jgi:hypothetical protein
MGDPFGSAFDPTSLGLPADFRLTNYSALCVVCGTSRLPVFFPHFIHRPRNRRKG